MFACVNLALPCMLGLITVTSVVIACVCARNALDSVAGQHKADLQQARQQAVDEFRARAAPCEPADVSDTSLLTETQATNAVSLHVIYQPSRGTHTEL